MKWINKVPLLVLTLQMLFALPASAQNGTWTTKASMPTARYSLGVGVINGKIYAIGGTTSVTSSGSDFSVVEVYDPANNTWSTVAPMPTPRHGFGVGVVSGVLYTIGGYSFNTCNCLVGTVEAYDPISNTWSTKASMPTVRQDLVVAAINDGLYAVGGGNGGYLSTVEAYDPASDSWSTKSSMPTPRLGPAAGVVDGILYVVGGGTPSGSITTNEAYNPVSDTWSTKASMPTARYFTGAMGGGTVTVNEILYVIGGITSGHNTTSASEAYDATSDSWTQIAPMPTRETLIKLSAFHNRSS